ncbi:acyl carrier protein, partial [Paenibacillus xylaniclasticus]|uniref:acyl carrier protein n=1 Tax=Paenibacillus xylaniclasticus TaxID=588083 RepID=UPI0013DEBB59
MSVELARLLDICKELLGSKQITGEESFFEAGGDSISAAQLISRINQEFGCKMTLMDIFINPTIGDLA